MDNVWKRTIGRLRHLLTIRIGGFMTDGDKIETDRVDYFTDHAGNVYTQGQLDVEKVREDSATFVSGVRVYGFGSYAADEVGTKAFNEARYNAMQSAAWTVKPQ